MSHWSERPIVTVSWRIGYAFSTPDGALMIKFPETPSRSAGLIISAFRAGLLLRLLFAGRRRGRVLRRHKLRQCGLEHRLTGRLCVLVIERHHDRLSLIDPREIPPLDECATVRVRVQLADLHRIAGRG